LTLAQVKQLLSFYTPDSFEEKVPYAALYAISKESAKSPVASLLVDLSSPITIKIASLHYIELEDLHQIPFPKSVVEQMDEGIAEQVKQR
jgi:hypothetical protein